MEQADGQRFDPMLLDQLVDEQALLVEAKKTGLDKDPDVQRTVRMAEDRALASALSQSAILQFSVQMHMT